MGRKRGDSISSAESELQKALHAVAEAVVLADPNDTSSFDELLRRIVLLSAKTGAGTGGDAVRAGLADLSETAGRLMQGLSADIGADMAALVQHFEVARRALEVGAAQTETTGTGKIHRAAPFEQLNPLAEDEGLVRDFVARATEHLETADEHLIVLERDPSDRSALDAVFRTFHTIKGMSGFLGFSDIEALCHDTETRLDGPRKGDGEFTPEDFDVVFGAVDAMRALVAARTKAKAKSKSASASAASGEDEPAPCAAAQDAGDPAPPEPAGSSGAAAQKASGTVTPESIVRVDEQRLDQLLDAIGEFVIAEAMTSEAARANPEAWGVLAERFARLDKITRELQEMATSLRMVPVRSTFRGMARLVRDLARKSGKNIEFTTEGDDTELDKAMVDMLTDPLLHLLRNAVDHGIEDAEARKAAGKTEVSRIDLRAYHAGGSACIEVSDNGSGLDPAALLAKARAQGIVGENENLSEAEIFELIFLPGFSTASKVTDVSGRGVGMDVVRGAVETLRGNIDIRSIRGEGTSFVLRLPLTLAIIDGMVLQVAGERYIVPTLSILRSVRPSLEELSGVLGKGEMLSLPDGLVPLVRLDRLFGRPGAGRDPADGIVVVVGENDSRVGLVVCDLLGQQQTVIKPLGEGMRDVPGVSGAAVMPDGTVGLILDVPRLVRLAQSGSVEAA